MSTKKILTKLDNPCFGFADAQRMQSVSSHTIHPTPQSASHSPRTHTNSTPSKPLSASTQAWSEHTKMEVTISPPASETSSDGKVDVEQEEEVLNNSVKQQQVVNLNDGLNLIQGKLPLITR